MRYLAGIATAGASPVLIPARGRDTILGRIGVSFVQACAAQHGCVLVRGRAMEKCSVYTDCQQEALRYKWIESEKAGCDQGNDAMRRWFQQHCNGYLSARWLEHLQGSRFWVELDRADFGLC